MNLCKKRSSYPVQQNLVQLYAILCHAHKICVCTKLVSVFYKTLWHNIIYASRPKETSKQRHYKQRKNEIVELFVPPCGKTQNPIRKMITPQERGAPELQKKKIALMRNTIGARDGLDVRGHERE